MAVDTGLEDDKDVVSFEISSTLRTEIERLKKCFPGEDLSDGDLYSRAFSLLGVYVKKCDSDGHLHISPTEEQEPGQRMESISVPGYVPPQGHRPLR